MVGVDRVGSGRRHIGSMAEAWRPRFCGACTEDETIPVKHARELAAGCRSPCLFEPLYVDGAGHSDVDSVGGKDVQSETSSRTCSRLQVLPHVELLMQAHHAIVLLQLRDRALWHPLIVAGGAVRPPGFNS